MTKPGQQSFWIQCYDWQILLNADATLCPGIVKHSDPYIPDLIIVHMTAATAYTNAKAIFQ